MPIKISVIISYYKNQDALALILKALGVQTFKDFEVIVSEDDHNQGTGIFIEKQRQLYTYPIQHLNQPADNGFRKNEMLNKSIVAAKGEILVFLDGDCIPHSRFLKAHLDNIGEHLLCFGRRVMLDEVTTKNLYQTKDLGILGFFRLLGTKTKRLKFAIYLPFMKKIRPEGIWGCNYGILKKHLMEINGFDEDYVTAGVGEDVDLEWRLKAKGVKFMSIRHEALQFHLYHKENYTMDAINTGMKQLKQKQEAQLFFCKNGIQKQGVA